MNYVYFDFAGFGSNRRKHKEKMSWNDAHNNSQIQKCNMLSIGDNLKNTVSLLKKNTTTWVNKYTNYELPESGMISTLSSSSLKYA